MHEFKFEKALYKTSELIKIVSISKATFYRFVNSWIAKGNDPALILMAHSCYGMAQSSWTGYTNINLMPLQDLIMNIEINKRHN